MARDGACNRARGGTQHLLGSRGVTVGIQGQVPALAVGHAYAETHLLKESGLVIAQIGDGTFGQGALYESFLWAGLYRPKILYVLEDNDWAMTTRRSETFVGDLRARCEGFGVEYIQTSDEDTSLLMESCNFAIERARQQTPVCLHVETRRLGGHSRSNDQRPPETRKLARETDPLLKLLRQPGPAQEFAGHLERLQALAERILSEREPIEPERNPTLKRNARASHPCALSNRTIGESLTTSLIECLQHFDDLVIFGEDVRYPAGGASGITKGVSSEAPSRVLNTPISEQEIVAFGNGISIAGCKAIGEVMFGDFLALAFDEIINVGAKLKFLGLDNGRYILRVSNADLGRGYGPTHSQNLDACLSA